MNMTCTRSKILKALMNWHDEVNHQACASINNCKCGAPPEPKRFKKPTKVYLGREEFIYLMNNDDQVMMSRHYGGKPHFDGMEMIEVSLTEHIGFGI